MESSHAINPSDSTSPAKDYIVLLREIDIWQKSKLVLSNVSLTIESGEFVYLIGNTGSGKTSLLKTLYADLALKDGHALILGYDLKKITEQQIPFLRRKLGIVFQDFQLLEDRNVKANLEFVLKATGWNNNRNIETRIREVLGMVGIEELSHKSIHEISGGEQQRVVIARALLNKPRLLLADEPTGNLDPGTSNEIIRLFKKLSVDYQMAVLLATHDHRIMEAFPSRTLQCESDKLIERTN